MASAKRDHLIDTALDLFYQGGFHAVGIDRVIAQAGIARMTLYNHFKSKDELILATLQRRDEKFLSWFVAAIERLSSPAENQLLTVFDVLDEWFAAEGYAGCMFINAAAEYSDPKNPINVATRKHKQLVLEHVQEIARGSGVVDPDDVADGIVLLMEGAITTSFVCGDRHAAIKAKRAARKLIG
ncbi:MAG: TetR/AcrR family transcriptional regulator [Cohaesibacteraceae bacterium]|nr:TetR/AcrR family transcriptional regulator [Cohaesibacteraceae bacterium]MBL4876421.1 TetR/AcrR family transcriptional regulator [Cohaesibacteraceae bacterium]